MPHCNCWHNDQKQNSEKYQYFARHKKLAAEGNIFAHNERFCVPCKLRKHGTFLSPLLPLWILPFLKSWSTRTFYSALKLLLASINPEQLPVAAHHIRRWHLLNYNRRICSQHVYCRKDWVNHQSRRWNWFRIEPFFLSWVLITHLNIHWPLSLLSDQ